MSIHPNRVLARIIEQVEQSDWPALASTIRPSSDADGWVRLYRFGLHERYATPFHFWVHALRDELAARGRVQDLMGVAGHALCQNQTFSDWAREFDPSEFLVDARDGDLEIYRMQASECRRSSVVRSRDSLIASFWGHGPGESWRRRGER